MEILVKLMDKILKNIGKVFMQMIILILRHQ